MKAFWQHGLLKEFKGSSDNFRASLTVYMAYMVITSPFLCSWETRLLQNKRVLGSEKPGDGSDGSPTWLQMCTLTRCAIQRRQNRDRAPCAGGFKDLPDRQRLLDRTSR